MIRHFANLLLWVLPPTRLFALRRFLLRLASVSVGERACICGRGWIYGRGRLVVGDDTWLSPEVTVYTHKIVEVVIGSNCDIGHGVVFVTGSHEVGERTRRAGKGLARSIVIGDGSWIGAYARILGGVTIGKGCVVAAGAVVTKDIPDNVLAAGVPAVVKRKLD